MTQLVNPKDVEAQATAKVRLDLLEPAGNEAIAAALANGAEKYGIRNYVESPISARVYVAAMMRHLAAWLRGEDVAEDSGVHHLGHLGANVHIALAAIEAGTFIDDRHGKAGQGSSAKPPTVEPSALQVAIRDLGLDAIDQQEGAEIALAAKGCDDPDCELCGLRHE